MQNCPKFIWDDFWARQEMQVGVKVANRAIELSDSKAIEEIDDND